MFVVLLTYLLTYYTVCRAENRTEMQATRRIRPSNGIRIHNRRLNIARRSIKENMIVHEREKCRRNLLAMWQAF